MKPIVTIVGRPNVGKSTLYNRLTRSRDALVDDNPGVTRDRMVGVGYMGARSFWVVDTGGLDADDPTFAPLLEEQVEHALTESDAVIFLVDGRSGPTASDEEIAARLRRWSGPVFLAVNKLEGMTGDVAVAEFFSLGLASTPFPVSATQGDGVRVLIEHVLEACSISTTSADAEETTAEPGAHFAVIGRPNVGKSTLVNRVLGEKRMIVADHPGTTRDTVRIPFRREQVDYVLVDTPGVRRRAKIDERLERVSVLKSLQTLEAVQVVVLVVDAQSGISEQDARLAGLAEAAGRAMVIVVNKWDGLEPHQRQRVRLDVERRLPMADWAPVIYTSATFGSGVGDLLPAVQRVYQATTAELGTARLNQTLRAAQEHRPPPLVGGQRIKLKYAHQGGRNPPQVVIHGNLVTKVPDSYRRYLANRIRQDFDLVGTPVQISFRSGVNPYAGRGRGRRRRGH